LAQRSDECSGRIGNADACTTHAGGRSRVEELVPSKSHPDGQRQRSGNARGNRNSQSAELT
jgi:hypothetical protein